MDETSEPRRRDSLRLSDWDYASPGAYFTTICTKGRKSFFGRIQNGEVHLSTVGKQAHCLWERIPHHHSHLVLDEFIIMPNHVHGILFIHEVVAAFHETPPRHKKTGSSQRMSAISPKPGSLSVVVRLYKGAVTRWARAHGFHDFSWQSRFHEHVIRNERELDSIRRYIRLNPKRWSMDRFHP